ncbi:MAG: type IX secretion system membrane protein PorP/SprF [Cytophagales bacterium]|nr:type IX secretion system membrane protein PorP/SprF [Bernardetiaceae bacterium]MDW8211442.1 type IX secretion system membrane protein PorP/SprF [Cytophagales bacterium]
MKKELTYLLVLLWAMLLVKEGASQQDAQFTQFMFNQLYVNPATAGIDSRFVHFNLIHRRQWVGYSTTLDGDGGAPISTVFTATMPINIIRSGIGIQVLNDALGPITNNDIQFSYAYHHPFKNQARLSIGIRGGVYNQAFDFGKLRPNEPNDPLIIGRGRESQFVPDFAVGIYYSTPKYFAGISTNHLFQPSFEYGTTFALSPLERTYTFLGGGEVILSPSVSLQPSAIVKTNLRNVLSYEGALLAHLKQKYHIGASFRDLGPISSISAIVSTRLLKDNSMSMGYAFDYEITGAAAKAATSHELRITYRIPAPKKAELFNIRTPRFRFE